MTTVLVMIAIVAGIWFSANLMVWTGSKICAAYGHRPLESDEQPGHKFCGRCHVDL